MAEAAGAATGERVMPLLEHLDELRSSLFRAAVVTIILVGAAWAVSDRPARRPHRPAARPGPEGDGARAGGVVLGAHDRRALDRGPHRGPLSAVRGLALRRAGVEARGAALRGALDARVGHPPLHQDRVRRGAVAARDGGNAAVLRDAADHRASPWARSLSFARGWPRAGSLPDAARALPARVVRGRLAARSLAPGGMPSSSSRSAQP